MRIHRLKAAEARLPNTSRPSFIRTFDQPVSAAGEPLFFRDTIPEEERTAENGLTHEEILERYPGAFVFELALDEIDEDDEL